MDVLQPTDLTQALAAIADDPGALLLAGGTDLMVAVNEGAVAVERVIALRAVPEIVGWRVDGDDVVIGAGTTYAALATPEVAAVAPALAHAARTVGSPQIRNAGTIGGNLATASPAGDTLPVLVAGDATVECASVHGTRSVAARDFLTGPKRTALRTGELITAVRIPRARGPQDYLKVGVRNAMVIAVASLALVVDLDRRRLAVGLGSVGPTALVAPDAAEWLAERLDWSADGVGLADPTDAAAFADRGAAVAAPIADHRSTAAYRRHAIGVLARRALVRACGAGPTSEIAA